MNTILLRITRLALINLLVLLALSLYAQKKNDTLYVNNSDIIKQYGRSIDFNAESKALIQRNIRMLVDSCLLTMKLREEASEQFDQVVIEKFKSYFDEQAVVKNVPAIPNFFQPRACLDTSSFPAYYSVQSYCDSAQRWFDYIEILKETDVVANDFYFKFRGEIYTNALVSIEFSAPSRIDCKSMVRQSVNLNFWFTMSKQKYIYKSGVEIPIQYKIRFLEIQPDTIKPPVTIDYKNRWSFLNLTLHGGGSAASFKSLSEYNDITIEPAETYGALASLTFIASDTFTVFNKVRRWEYGLDIGISYNHVVWNWQLDTYKNEAYATLSPLNDLLCNHTLLTQVKSLTEKKTFDVLSVPLSLSLKRYFTPKKINAIILNAGVSFNYLLNNTTEITSGTISYVGKNCAFQDPQSGDWIEGITIDDLPYYGFGTYDAVLNSGDDNKTFEPYYIAAHLKVGFDLRKDRYARLHWIIAPYVNYSITELRSGNTPDKIIEPAGNITDLSMATTSIKPFSFGIEVGISYNFKQNSLKNIRTWKKNKSVNKPEQ
ncbi:MAG: hypothetical protein NT175_02080 [Bacteroidetes bacterium]|nr:hypothetical protein [Bacteroidota bacterium]